jgi:rod shape-determining protein MreD
MLRVAAIFLTHLVIWTLLGALNHALGTWQLHVFAGGLFVTFAGFHMTRRAGLAAVLMAGFLFDAASPVPFGQHALVFGILFTLLLSWRHRIAHDEPAVLATVTVLVNLILLGVLALLRLRAPAWMDLDWGRLLWEMLASSLVVGLAAPWISALQAAALELSMTRRFRRRSVTEEN